MKAARIGRATQRVLRYLAFALTGAFILMEAGRLSIQSAERLRHAGHHATDEILTARRRVFGAAYVDSVEAIRRVIPPGHAYGLAMGVDSETFLWARFDLSPRPAVFVGPVRRRNAGAPGTAPPPPLPRFYVVAWGPGEPLWLQTAVPFSQTFAPSGQP